MEIAKISSVEFFSNCFANLRRLGNSSWQGEHQVAQKLTKMTGFLMSVKLTFLSDNCPDFKSKSAKLKSGTPRALNSFSCQAKLTVLVCRDIMENNQIETPRKKTKTM